MFCFIHSAAVPHNLIPPLTCYVCTDKISKGDVSPSRDHIGQGESNAELRQEILGTNEIQGTLTKDQELQMLRKEIVARSTSIEKVFSRSFSNVDVEEESDDSGGGVYTDDDFEDDEEEVTHWSAAPNTNRPTSARPNTNRRPDSASRGRELSGQRENYNPRHTSRLARIQASPSGSLSPTVSPEASPSVGVLEQAQQRWLREHGLLEVPLQHHQPLRYEPEPLEEAPPASRSSTLNAHRPNPNRPSGGARVSQRPVTATRRPLTARAQTARLPKSARFAHKDLPPQKRDPPSVAPRVPCPPSTERQGSRVGWRGTTPAKPSRSTPRRVQSARSARSASLIDPRAVAAAADVVSTCSKNSSGKWELSIRQMEAVLLPLHNDFMEWFQEQCNAAAQSDLSLSSIEVAATKYYGRISPMYSRQKTGQPQAGIRSTISSISLNESAKEKVERQERNRLRRVARASGFVNDGVAHSYGNGWSSSNRHDVTTTQKEITKLLTFYHRVTPPKPAAPS